MNKTISRFILSTGLVATSMFAAPTVFAQCAAPVSIEGGINYDPAADTLNVCDGTNWIVVGPGGITADSIDWDDITDTMTLDATTTIDMTAGDLNFDNDTFVIDSSANEIGIGTNNPGGILHLNNNNNARVELLSTTGSTGTAALSRTYHRNTGFQGLYTGVTGTGYTDAWLGQGSNEGFIVSSASQFNIINAHTNAPMVFMAGSNTAPSEVMRLTYDARLGIGTAGNPDANAALEVSGTDLGFLPPRNTDPATNITGTAGLIAYDSTDNELQFYNGSAWVTIGTTASGDNLGDHTATQNIQLGTNWLSNDGDSEGLRIDATTGAVLIQNTAGTDEELHIGPEGGTSTDTAISMENNGNTFEIHVQDDNLFRITDAAETENWFTLAGASGNIGIGNNSPDAPLHIGGVDITTEGGTHEFILSENGAGQPNILFIDGSSDETSMGITTDDYFAIATEDTQSGMQFKVNADYTTDMLNTGTVAMTIATDGDVAIGSSAPDANAVLDINGGTNKGFLPPRNTDPGTNITGTAGLIAYDSTDNELQFYNGSAWVALATGGGITPDSLDWDDFTDTMTLDATTTIDMDTNTADLNFDNGTFYIDSSENIVGIGTATPNNHYPSTIGTSLEIRDTHANGSAELLLSSGSSSVTGMPQINFGIDTTHVGYIRSRKTATAATASHIQFGTHDGTTLAERMRIAATGEVGIGTETPQTKLHVYDASAGAAIGVEGDENSISGLGLYTTGDGATVMGSGVGSRGWLWEAKGSTWATADEREDLFLTYWDGSAWNEWMFISHDTGNIGLGGDIDPDVLLDMPGTIKLGDGGESCDADREGSIRYDGTGDTFYFCATAGSWEAVSLGSGVNAIDDLSDAASDATSVFLGSGSGANDDGTTNENTGLGINAMNATTSGDRNVAVGNNALASNTTSGNIIAIGNDAMENFSDTGSGYLIAIGNRAGRNHSSGWRNIAIGHDALMEHVNGNDHIGIGYQALMNADGQDNVGIGSNSGQYAGWRNTMIGLQAGQGTSAAGTADGNVMLGYRAGTITEDADNNTLIGFQAGDVLTTGDNNIIIGYDVDPSSATVSNELNIGGTIFGNLSSNRVGIGVTDATAINANAALEVTGTNLGFLPPRNTDPATNITGTAGLIAYDSTDNELQFYNGSSWVAVATGSGGASSINDLSDGSTNYAGTGSMYLGNSDFSGATGSQNVVLGAEAGDSLTSGGYNTLIGRLTGFALSTGTQNTFVGTEAGRSTVSGIQNTFIGEGAGYNNTASYNTFVGRAAGDQNVGGASNTFIGHHAAHDNTSGGFNTAIGREALNGNTTTSNNTAIGYRALYVNNASDNLAIGYQALLANTTGSDNLAIGNNALDAVTTTGNNLAIGNNALSSIVTGYENTAIGADAGQNLATNSYQNVLVGKSAGENMTQGYHNIGIGYGAGYAGLGFGSVAIGNGAIGSYSASWGTTQVNVGIGLQSLSILTDGTGNVAVGGSTGGDFGASARNGEMNHNTLIGYRAGNNLDASVTSPEYNTFLGSQAGSNVTTGSSNILIGYGVSASSATVSNELNIGGLIHGDIGSSEVFIDAPASAPADGDLANGQVTFWVDATNDEIELKARDSAGDIINATVGGGGGGGGASAINDLSDATTDYTTDYNLFIGQNAGASIASGGIRNVAIGQNAGDAITTGDNNITIGYAAGSNISTNIDIIAIGSEAGADIGNQSIAIGSQAGFQSNGGNTLLLGAFSGYSPTVGDNNIALGWSALYGGGSDTIAIGSQAANGVYSGSDPIESIFIGTRSAQNITSGDRNIFLGHQTGDITTTGSDNIVIGHNLDPSSASASNELNIGNLIHGDLTNNEVFLDAPAAAPADGDLANGQITFWLDAASDEIELKARDSAGDIINATVGGGGGGASAINDLSDAYTDYVTDNNLAMGDRAGEDIASGATYNTLVGQLAGKNLTTGDESVAIGYDALGDATVQGYSVAVGYRAAANWTASSEYHSLIAIGASAAGEHTNGFENIAIGNTSMNLGGGDRNTLVGGNTGYNGIGSENSVFGHNAMNRADGDHNVIMGQAAAYGAASSTINRNVIIGQDAATGINTGANDNIIIGYNAGDALTTGANNIIIGSANSGVDLSSGTVSNELNIGGIIHGDIANSEVFLDAPASAPADGDLANGQVTFWVDATNNEIELKGKDSAGDVINVTVGSGGGGGSSVWSTSGSDAYYSTGNVGIGTTPTDLVTISGHNESLVIRDSEDSNNERIRLQVDDWNNASINVNNGLEQNVFFTSNDGTGLSGFHGVVIRDTGSNEIPFNETSAALHFDVASRGFLPPRNADPASNIGSPATGLLAFDTTDGELQMYNGSAWVAFATGSGSAWSTSGSDVYYNTGNVGIGQTPAAGVELDILGDIEYTGTITDVSDRRLKENIKPLNKHGSLIEKINAVDTYSFTMKDDEDGKTEFGVIAQELEEIFPELVRTADDEMGTKSVNYVGLIAPMIEATKELKSENDALKAELSEIKQDIAGMKMHTGYGFEKANIQNLAMMFFMMIFGGACVIAMNRFQRKS